jgi:hypothetical protein
MAGRIGDGWLDLTPPLFISGGGVSPHFVLTLAGRDCPCTVNERLFRE